MENAIATVLVALITGIVTIITTVYQNKVTRQKTELDAIRNQILTLITTDHVHVIEGNAPSHKLIIHDLYDKYRTKGGNSYICDIVAEYDKWEKEQRKIK